MRTALVPLNATGAIPLGSEETFERHEQVRTQTSLLTPDRVQISVFEQARKKFLHQILCFFSSKAVSPDKSVKRSPISATEYFECSLCSGRFALRLQYYAPIGGGERCRGVLSGSCRTNFGQLANAFGVLSGAHAAIEVKTCSKIKPLILRRAPFH